MKEWLVNRTRLVVEPLGYRVVPLAMLEPLECNTRDMLRRQERIDALLAGIDAKAKEIQDKLTRAPAVLRDAP